MGLTESRKTESDSIFDEFQMASTNSQVFIKVEYSKKNRLQKDCGFDLLWQRGWSVDITAKVVYVRRGKILRAPKEAILELMPLRNMLRRQVFTSLTQVEFEDRASRHLSEKGTYDGELLYDATRLISYPQLNRENSTIKLSDRVAKNFKFRITIPEDFPPDLVNKIIHLRVGGRMISKGVGLQLGAVRLLVIG